MFQKSLHAAMAMCDTRRDLMQQLLVEIVNHNEHDPTKRQSIT
jgi:hypothetical protein